MGTPDRPDRLDRDDLGVVAGGAVVVVAAFLPWYEARDGAVALTGWGLGFTALVGVLLAAYAAGRVLLLRGRPPKPDVPVTPQAETLVASGVALLLLLYRLLDAPPLRGQPGRRTTALAVAAAAVLFQFLCAARKARRTGVRAR